MALATQVEFETTYGKQSVACYARVLSLAINKTLIPAEVDPETKKEIKPAHEAFEAITRVGLYEKKDGRLYQEIQCRVLVDLEGENLYKQVYKGLKKLKEFSAAKDC